MKKKVVIVGGVAGGASAAARLRRLDEELEILILEKGDYISYANCGLPYYIGGVIGERNKLFLQTPEGMQARYNIEVRTGHEVVAIDRDKKEIEVKENTGGRIYREKYDKLLLSPGAFPLRPNIPGLDGVNLFTLRNVNDTDRIKNFIRESGPQTALVVGAGFIGLEMAENLIEAGLKVSLVEMAGKVLPKNLDYEMAAPLHRHLRENGVTLYLNNSLTSVERVSGETWANLRNGERLRCDLIIMAAGTAPDTHLAKEAGLAIGETGGIKVNERLQTSDPDIYAVGDAIEVINGVTGEASLIPLAGPANRQGRVVADAILGRDVKYEGAIGTSVVKVFDLTAGSVGLTEEFLKYKGLKYLTSITHSYSHATYYPASFPLTIKLLYTPEGRLLGAQVVGYEGVDKRLDVLATVIKTGGAVHDLASLELAYAPPYSSAKDPVNIAGYVAGNIIGNDMSVAYWHEVNELNPAETLVLDVREKVEREAGYIENSVHIPLNALRGRMSELPREKEIIVYCQVGLRAYLAARLLQQNGFRVRNLTGGYRTWKEVEDDRKGVVGESKPPVQRREEKGSQAVKIAHTVILDACGLQCPGPIMTVAEKMSQMNPGDYLEVLATDPGFPRDIQVWSERTGNLVVSSEKDREKFRVLLQKGTAPPFIEASAAVERERRGKTLVVFSGDLDKAIASFIIANGAAAMGRPVTMFFTFWGLNILRRPEKVKVPKNLLEKAFGIMMPRGSRRLALSKMNMAGLGGRMIRWIMRKKNIFSLEELIDQARRAGVRLVACQMSMDVMGIKPEELIDGVEIGGVASYLGRAEEADLNLFI